MRPFAATLAAGLLLALSACTNAGPPTTATTLKGAGAPQPTPLGVGDPAPELAVDDWVNGAPVTRFEPGKIYVLDFWATWCGPCVEAMPHLEELAKAHAADGVVVVPVSTVGRGNSADDIRDYATQNKGKFPHLTYAICQGPTTDRRFMAAAQQTGIPTTFVVGRDGKIAFIGHPLDLDEKLPAILAGK